MRDHQTSKARALVPHAHAHHARLAILSAPDASVALRSPRHAHASMRIPGGGLADRDDLARKSPTA
eukprot:4490626-Prymnesium_polylepis.1